MVVGIAVYKISWMFLCFEYRWRSCKWNHS
jgi:hypothetical protein